MSENNPNPEHQHEQDDTQRLSSGGAQGYGPSEHGYAQQGGQWQGGQQPGGQPPYSPYGQYGQPGYGYYGQPQPKQKTSRPSGVFTAGIVAASLVVGAMAGLAGAVGYSAVEGNNGNGGANASTAATSTITNHPNGPAANGSVQQVAQSVLPSVVKINVRGPQGAGSGSGIILSSDGEILTNNHVVEVAAGGGEMWVNFNDGSTAKATVVGTDPLTDLAVIKAQGVSGLHPATLDKSPNLDVGQEVVAIGSPFGLEATVTSGIISALNRPVSVSSQGNGMSTAYPAIQTDAAINPGNSGGPLVNMNGEVVGINSSIRTASSSPMGGEGGSIGLGFAIPISKVLPVVQQLRHGQTATHARLGVSVTDASSNNGMLSGAGVASVNAGSAAAKAGLQRGDVITKVGDEPITGAESLVATIRGHRPGDTVTLTVVRDGSTQKIRATLDSDGGNPSS